MDEVTSPITPVIPGLSMPQAPGWPQPMPSPAVPSAPPVPQVAIPTLATPAAQMDPKPAGMVSTGLPVTHATVRTTDSNFTKKQILFIVGLGLLGLLLGAGTAFVLNTLGVSLIGGQ